MELYYVVVFTIVKCYLHSGSRKYNGILSYLNYLHGIYPLETQTSAYNSFVSSIRFYEDYACLNVCELVIINLLLIVCHL